MTEKKEKGLKTQRCSKCNAKIPEGSKICVVCGKPLPGSIPTPRISPKASSTSPQSPQIIKSMCPQCYAEFAPEVKFCKDCGIETQEIVKINPKYTCPRCYSEIESGLDYCPECGSDLKGSSHNCPKCFKEIPPGMSYCTECGTPLDGKKTLTSAIRDKLRIRRELNHKPSKPWYESTERENDSNDLRDSNKIDSNKKESNNNDSDVINVDSGKLIQTPDHDKTNKPGYLVCNICGAYYQLQPGESPDDFENECSCGGELQYKSKL